jgi:hypothetical protein
VTALASALLGAAPAQMDSQVVLARYAAALARFAPPANVVFTYSVSQAGPHNIEQLHRIYRSGQRVRDETLAIDGQSLKHKATRFAQYRDRYSVDRLAPREAEYTLLFLSAKREGKHYQYTYEAIPLIRSSAFVVQRLTIDGASFLPSSLQFRTAREVVQGNGQISYGRIGTHWVPTVVQVTATVRGKPARERIAFSAYAFPRRLPLSTFAGPKPLPARALPH